MRTASALTLALKGIIALTLVAVLVLALAVVAPPTLSFTEVWRGADNAESYIFWRLRLPRHVLAFVTGSALSIAGASFQSLLQNPLADPYILGVSGGAALGYVAGVVTGLPFWLMPLAGFASALAAITLIYTLARDCGTLNPVSLLLTGVIFNSFSFALILLINALAPFGQSQQILFLLLGAVESVPWPQIALMTLLTVICAAVLIGRANRLNLLSQGEEEAFHLGVNVVFEKKLVFVTTSLLVGASVSLCGLIGFVGLFVPHLARRIIGADHRALLPACALGGGLFLMTADFIAGYVLMWESVQTRLPVGVITALIGAPVFAWLMKRENVRTQ